MKPGKGLAPAAAVIAAAFVFYALASGGAPRPALPSGNSTIIISKGIGAIDPGAVFNPTFVRIIAGVNNTVVWINQSDAPVDIESADRLFKSTVAPGMSFGYTFDQTCMHRYHVDSGPPGTVLASATELEAGRLAPAPILQKSHEEIARNIVRAVESGDDISSVRLNDTRTIAYTSAAGADIIVHKQLCIICHSSSYEPVIYTGPPVLLPSADMDVLMNFTGGVMDDICYEMDGSEWVDAVDFGSRVKITVRQKAGGWILPVPAARFDFGSDRMQLELGRWYENIASHQFGLSSDEAQEAARDFMDDWVNSHPLLAKYLYKYSAIQDARIDVLDDKVMYAVPVFYQATNPEYLDDMDHCGRPSCQGVMVLVDTMTGRVFGWMYSMCE